MQVSINCNQGHVPMHNAMENKRPLPAEPEMSIHERYYIFCEKYKNMSTYVTVDDEMFTKCYAELSEADKNKYTRYARALEGEEDLRRKEEDLRRKEEDLRRKEEDLLRNREELVRKEQENQDKLRAKIIEQETRLKEEERISEEKFEDDKKAFSERFRQLLSEEEINEFCNLFKPYLGDLLNKQLNESKINFLNHYAKLAIKNEDIRNQFFLKSGYGKLMISKMPSNELLYPMDMSRNRHVAPSEMNSSLQVENEYHDRNFIYAYPFKICTHFPVVFAHEIFIRFHEIVNNHFESKACKDYSKFVYKQSSETLNNIDKCVAGLISSLLGAYDSESTFVESFVSGLKNFFPSGSVKTQATVDMSKLNSRSNLTKIDASIPVGSFPFILFEAKLRNFSINATLQALQYYALSVANNIPFVDNRPAFLITFGLGILHVYGVATLNNRIICDCLLTMEITNHHFNVNWCNEIIYKLVSSLYYFHDEFTKRMEKIAISPGDDEMHLKYSKLMRESTIDNKPQPAIFEVSSFENQGTPIPIKFEKKIENIYAKVPIASNIKPNVYIVNFSTPTSPTSPAILKLCFNYNIDVHDCLARLNLAPKIIGFDSVLGGNYKVVLMEYDIKYRPIHEFLAMHRDQVISLDLKALFESIKAFLSQIHSQNIVHGDFRVNNIIARISSNDPKLLTDFKVIDFEFSGRVGERYPSVFIKNPGISWHQGFSSNAKREFEHDTHFLPFIESMLGL